MHSNNHDHDHTVLTEPLSCKLCRKRKVRCDKRHPCNNCQKSNLDCVFPQGRQRPTQGRSSRDTELFRRLRHLETALQALRSSGLRADRDEEAKSADSPSSQKSPESQDNNSQTDQDVVDHQVESMAEDFGRLHICNGRSRYTSNALWASLSQEILDMHELLDENTSEDEGSSPGFSSPRSSWQWPGNAGLLFNSMSNEGNISTLHPSKTQMLTLWSIYEQNVNPVVRIFHGPTTKTLFEAVSTGAETITTITEPALFAIYYAAVVSLNAEECQSLIQESRARLLKKYRWGLEQALARADFFNSSALIVLQAFALFAICVRRHDDTRLIVMWSAIAIRIAMSLGLHRDGTHFGLDPFQTEIRRRIWWHLVLLDVDSSRDHGMDAMLFEPLMDTRMPLNINDEDIFPDIVEPPTERTGFSEMTTSITRFETSMMAKRLSCTWPRVYHAHSGVVLRSLAEKEKAIRELQTRLNEKYLQHCDFNVPLQWATAVNVRSACAMLWMIIYHPRQRQSESISQDMKDQLFSGMVEVVENTRLLECSKATSQWGWYFHNDVQWPAIAYVLNELLIGSPGPSLSRAWRVIDAARRQWDADSSPLQKGMLWRTVKTMTAKAGLLDPERSGPNTSIPNESDSVQKTDGGNAASNGGSDDSPLPRTQAFEPDVFSTTLNAPNELGLMDYPIGEDPWFLLEDDFLRSNGVMPGGTNLQDPDILTNLQHAQRWGTFAESRNGFLPY